MTSSTSPLSVEERAVLADTLFRDYASLPQLDFLENKFPQRHLPDGAVVTRFAPSPTGFAHIGAIFASHLNRCLSQQSGGVFILRIEDTDARREVEGATEILIEALSTFKVSPDEGPQKREGRFESLGNYGPYIQSQRASLYRSVVYDLVKRGYAYPCFATEQELAHSSEIQRLQRVRPGYYGPWAKWRDAPLSKIFDAIESQQSFVMRLRSWGNYDTRLVWQDVVHGRMSVPSNDLDAVILKSDGSSLYHLAHAVDDHFMRITHVIRGDEWISSVPLHLQIFEACGWRAPLYAHISPIQKIDSEGGSDSRRKLSKRKDPEANVDYYWKMGFPIDAVLEYLTNLANAQFEAWRTENPLLPLREFPLRLENVSKSGMLIDLDKLLFVGKEVLSRMPLSEVMQQGAQWCKDFDPSLHEMFEKYPERCAAALNIEREGEKASKRVGAWSELRPQVDWFFDELFTGWDLSKVPSTVTRDLASSIVEGYLKIYDPLDSHTTWFNKFQELAEELQFARSVKEFKKNPLSFKGHVGDVTMVVRLALSGKTQTPDLCDSLRTFGSLKVEARLRRFLQVLKES